MRVKPLQTPSIKRPLVFLNLEIDALYNHYVPCYNYGLLSEFEKIVLALEDRRYFKHYGIDLKSIVREGVKALTFRRHGGASTINMQFVRTVNARRELTYARKLREMLISLITNYHFDKKAMLRSYLECAFFGSGLIGAERTAWALFGTWPGNLRDMQAAQLAAMLVYPNRSSRPSAGWKE